MGHTTGFSAQLQADMADPERVLRHMWDVLRSAFAERIMPTCVDYTCKWWSYADYKRNHKKNVSVTLRTAWLQKALIQLLLNQHAGVMFE
ncbi:hypothetical protein DZS_17270 [Dickeya ananatis]